MFFTYLFLCLHFFFCFFLQFQIFFFFFFYFLSWFFLPMLLVFLPYFISYVMFHPSLFFFLNFISKAFRIKIYLRYFLAINLSFTNKKKNASIKINKWKTYWHWNIVRKIDFKIFFFFFFFFVFYNIWESPRI